MPEVKLSVKVDEAEISRDITRQVRRQIGAWLRFLYQEVQRLFDLPKHGGPGDVRTRSAPFEPPARQHGDLGRSVHPYMIGNLSGALDVDEFYGAVLEDGTLDGRILPRPFASVAVAHFYEAEASGALDVPASGGSLSLTGGVL